MGPSTAANFSGTSGGIIMSLISFSIVFLVCAGLMGLMMSLKYVVRVFEEKEKKSQSGETPSAAKPPVGEPYLAQATPDDEGELVAVITAAVTAAFGNSVRLTDIRPSAIALAPPPTFSSIWKMASRIENNKGI